jgi:phosphoglycolate phosphatase-like HAD superfamily hydrolase
MSVTVRVPIARHDKFEVARPIRAALFDLDGTIADSFKVQRAALIEVARMSGRSISEHRVDAVLHQGYPKFLSSLGLHRYRNAYDQSYLRHVSRGQLFE